MPAKVIRAVLDHARQPNARGAFLRGRPEASEPTLTAPG
jgi:hypothetical protein